MTEKQRHTVIPRTLIFVFRKGKLLLIKYSGKGKHQTKEKEDRKDIYNALGGHIEANEDIIDNARREAKEEAGVDLINPKIKGIIHVSGFAGKDVMVFVVVAETNDDGLKSTLEGELEWVDPIKINSLNVFDDMRAITEKVMSLNDAQMLTGVSRFEGFKLLDIKLTATS